MELIHRMEQNQLSIKKKVPSRKSVVGDDELFSDDEEETEEEEFTVESTK